MLKCFVYQVITQIHSKLTANILPTITSYALEQATEGSPGGKDGKDLEGDRELQTTVVLQDKAEKPTKRLPTIKLLMGLVCC